jgi:hypothetical protein
MRNISDKFLEKIKTHFMGYNIFFFGNRAVYEIMWKNTVEADRPLMPIWHMRFACQIAKATKPQSGYVMLIAFPLRKWLYEQSSDLRYTYIT